MKILLVNGSPNKAGCTYTALRIAADAIEAESAETEIFHIPNEPIRGCAGCFACKKKRANRCVFGEDCVNTLIEKAEQSDAFIFGSPVYYSSPVGQLICAMDRAFFASGAFFGKPGAAICSARRAGNTISLAILNQYFIINRMPLITSTYWPMVHGVTPDDVMRDAEGVQTMQILGKNAVYNVKAQEATRDAGILPPRVEGGKIWTNFIQEGNDNWTGMVEP